MTSWMMSRVDVSCGVRTSSSADIIMLSMMSACTTARANNIIAATKTQLFKRVYNTRGARHAVLASTQQRVICLKQHRKHLPQARSCGLDRVIVAHRS